jgi:hypothetical protein
MPRYQTARMRRAGRGSRVVGSRTHLSVTVENGVTAAITPTLSDPESSLGHLLLVYLGCERD